VPGEMTGEMAVELEQLMKGNQMIIANEIA
jgi:hypothetical protein